MFLGASLAILVTMCLAILRAVLGPSVYDRILAANMFGTKTVLFLAVLSFLSGRPDFLDLALAYALINFVSVIAVLQFVERRARNRSKEDQASDAVKEGAQ
ncbi:pH regulation protein F [Iodidimonas gelatinilytica]|uniref:pH regulation protein F n=1 Tax=Iodidimonas gelatinilytica TaxID=1236966 RepID=A0A5A7MMX5_9PROT|nr:monovalent cation/H+ antiporter complex subunit F [Iodidimonas gelatinilytica]GEQ96365.1 pH regulation protein F [Iodidimonas gelatinilytica]